MIYILKTCVLVVISVNKIHAFVFHIRLCSQCSNYGNVSLAYSTISIRKGGNSNANN